MARRITRLSPDEPTCQLFTGHIGCGKSTELLRLKQKLEKENFHVVYFEATEDIDIGDVDVSDILLSIARRVSQSLEKAKIQLQPTRFQKLIQGAVELLNAEVTGLNIKIPGKIGFQSEGEKFSLSFGIGEITMKAKESPNIRFLLRQYMGPKVRYILDIINQELLKPAQEKLQQSGEKGVVVIIDNLDRIENKIMPNNSTQPEYLFIDRGEQLKQLHCHVVYSIPLVLTFSSRLEILTNRFGKQPKVLPMVRVRNRDGQKFEEGMNKMREMVLARAFPDIEPEQRLDLIMEVFDYPETLDRLCRVSGGHVRNLLVLLYSCLQKKDTPISSQILEDVIQGQRDTLRQAITYDESKLLSEIKERQWVNGEKKYKTLIPNLFVFQYQDGGGTWFSINPILEDLI